MAWNLDPSLPYRQPGGVAQANAGEGGVVVEDALVKLDGSVGIIEVDEALFEDFRQLEACLNVLGIQLHRLFQNLGGFLGDLVRPPRLGSQEPAQLSVGARVLRIHREATAELGYRCVFLPLPGQLHATLVMFLELYADAPQRSDGARPLPAAREEQGGSRNEQEDCERWRRMPQPLPPLTMRPSRRYTLRSAIPASSTLW